MHIYIYIYICYPPPQGSTFFVLSRNKLADVVTPMVFEYDPHKISTRTGHIPCSGYPYWI